MKLISRISLLLFSLLLAVACYQLFSFMVRLIDEAHYAGERVEVANQLGRFRLDLEQRLNATFYTTQSIEVLISTLDTQGASLLTQREKVEAWAKEAVARLPYVSHVGLSEGYIIRFVFPFTKNSAVGRDYRSLPGQWPAVNRAIKTQSPVVAGPTLLIQGGLGVICRIPLFGYGMGEQKGKFLGIASMVIDYPALLKSAGLKETEKHLTLAMRGRDGLGSDGETFHGEPTLFNKDSISQKVTFLGGEWQLAAKPKAGWSYESPYSRWLRLLGLLVSLLVFGLSYFAVRATQLRLQAAQEFSKALEQRVDERTQQLNLAKNQAEQANLAKSEFLAVMTHELRTPLNSILGLTQLIETMELDTLQRNYITKVVSSANLLLSLINNILSYTKVESGNMKLEQQPFIIAEISQKLKDVFEVYAAEKALMFSVEIADDVPDFIECDKGKLLQVLANLCGNAIKFTEHGSVTLSITKVPGKASDDCWLRFVVKDTGIGIQEQHQKIIFNPFTQIDNTVSREYQGSGLGLSICQRFVELMGGHIELTSQPSKGSKFCVEVPVNVLESKPAAASFSAQKLRDAVAQNLPILKGLKLILAEDNLVNQTFAVALLNKVGVSVKVAENGAQVLALLEQEPVHGVLMDIQMPQMDGITTTEKLRADKRFQKLPIIAMTANAMPEDKQRALAAGMDDFVAKPITFEHLFKVLQRYLQRDKLYPENDSKH